MASAAATVRPLLAAWVIPLGIFGAVAALFGPDFLDWWHEWREPDGFYSHGPVVPVLVGVLIWIDWDRLRKTTSRPSLWSLLLIVPALLLLAISRWSSIHFLGGFAWLLFLAGAAWLLRGPAMLRALLAPIALMFFMLPMPAELIEPISLPIQELSTAWATRYLNWAMIPAERDRMLIRLPHYSMTVGAECSGFKLLLGLMMFAGFLAAAHQGAWWKKLALVLLCIPLATTVNATRIALNGIVGELIGPRAGSTFHDNAGIFVWAMSFVGILLGMVVLRCNRLKGTGSSSSA